MGITFKLDAFEGPLDLLLHLIEKNKMSIYDIQIAPITEQYMEYIQNLQVDVSELDSMSDFIVMAATLLYIKSKMLLPSTKKDDADVEEDPREELVLKLLEYKKMKYVSEQLKEYQKEADNIFFRNSPIETEQYAQPPAEIEDVLEDISLSQLYEVFQTLMKRQLVSETDKIHMDYRIIKRDSYTVEEKSRYILDLIEIHETITFFDMFETNATKLEMIVTFMALLELVHKKKIRVYQEKTLSNIWIGGINDEEI